MKRHILFSILVIFLSGTIDAQEFKVNNHALASSFKSGDQIQAYASTTSGFVNKLPLVSGTNLDDVLIAEADYFQTGTQGDFEIKNLRSYLRFSVNHSYAQSGVERMEEPYVYRIVLKLFGYTLSAPTTPHVFQDTLTIAYIPDSIHAYQDIHMKSYYGFSKLEAQVMELYDVTSYFYPSGIPNWNGPLVPNSLSQAQISTNSGSNVTNYTNGLIYNNQGAFIKKNWTIEAGIDYQKYEINMPGSSPSQVYNNLMNGITLNVTHTAITNNNNVLKLDWALNNINEKPNMTNYELEWIYVDNYLVTLSNGNMTVGEKNAADLYYDFGENATRIITDKTSYEIPLLYKRGYIVYRVRMIRPDNTLFQHAKYGPWSMTSNTGSIQSLGSSHHYKIEQPHLNDAFNWNLQTSFAEEGKSKYVMGYFDGLLKNRQSVTKFNSISGQLIVAEPVYNYEGLNEIQSLPVPIYLSSDQSFKYQPGFLLNSNAQPLSAVDFDNKATTIYPGGSALSALHANSLASIYYSPSNPGLGIGASFLKSIPDAEGYPLVHTKFYPSDPSRVRYQGGAGKELQIKDGHISSFYYFEPQQNELTKYLGLHSGFAEFYEKQITKDPNGQISFSIMTNLGKPVMTGLAGTWPTPSNPDKPIVPIDGLSSVPVNSQITNLLPSKLQFWHGTQKELSIPVFNDMPGISTYKYSFVLPPYTPACEVGGITKYLGIPLSYTLNSQFEGASNPTTLVSSTLSPQASSFVSNTMSQVNLSLPTYSVTPSHLVGQTDINYTIDYKQEDLVTAVDNFITGELNTTGGTCVKKYDHFLSDALDALPDICDPYEEDETSHCSEWEAAMRKQLLQDNVYGKFTRYGISDFVVVGDRKSLYAVLDWKNAYGNLVTNVTDLNVDLDISNAGTMADKMVIYQKLIPYKLPIDPLLPSINPNTATQQDWDQYFQAIANRGYKAVYRYENILNNYLFSSNVLTTNPIPANSIFNNGGNPRVPSVQEMIDLMSESEAQYLLPIHPEYPTYKQFYCDNSDGVDFLDQLKNIEDYETAKLMNLHLIDQIIEQDPFYDWLTSMGANSPASGSCALYGEFNGVVKNKVILSIMSYPNPNNNPNQNANHVNLAPIQRLAYLFATKTNNPAIDDANLNLYFGLNGSGSLHSLNYGSNVTISQINALTADQKENYFNYLRKLYLARREYLLSVLRDNNLVLSTWVDQTKDLPYVEYTDASHDGNEVFEEPSMSTPNLDLDNPSNYSDGSPTGNPDFTTALNSTTPPPFVTNAFTNFTSYAEYVVNHLKNCLKSGGTQVTTADLTTIQTSLVDFMNLEANRKANPNYYGGLSPTAVKFILESHNIILDDLCNPFLFDYRKNFKPMMMIGQLCQDPDFLNSFKSMFSAPEFDILENLVLSGQANTISGSNSITLPSSPNLFEALLFSALGTNTLTRSYAYHRTNSTAIPNTPFQHVPHDLTYTFANSAGKQVVVTFEVTPMVDVNGLTNTLNGVYYALNPNSGYLTYNGNSISTFQYNSSNPPPANLFYNSILNQLGIGSLNANHQNGEFSFYSCSSLTTPNANTIDLDGVYHHTKDVGTTLTLGLSTQNNVTMDISLSCYYKYNITIEGLSESFKQEEYECITPIEYKEAYSKLKSDVLDAYQIKGAGHPFYETVLRSYMNQKLSKSKIATDYLDFMEGCNLTDQYEIPKYYSYIEVDGTSSQIDNFLASLNSHIITPPTPLQPFNLSCIPYTRIRESGSDKVYLNIEGLPHTDFIREAVTYIKSICSTSTEPTCRVNQLHESNSGSIPRIYDIYVEPSQTALSSATLLDLSTNATLTTTSVDIVVDGTPNAYQQIHIVFDNSLTHVQLSQKIDKIRQDLMSQTTMPYLSFCTHHSFLNDNNKLNDKKAYLAKAYSLSPANSHEQIIDELKVTPLTTSVFTGSFNGLPTGDYNDNGDLITYYNPDSKQSMVAGSIADHVSANLYLNNAPTTTNGLDFLKWILQNSKQSNLISNSFPIIPPVGCTNCANALFYPGHVYLNTTDAVNSNYSGNSFSGDYSLKYRRIDENIFLIRARKTVSAGSVPEFYHIYLKTPPGFKKSDLMNYFLDNPSTDIQVLPKGTDTRRFKIILKNGNGASSNAVVLYGRTNFALDNSTPVTLENVMLCDEPEPEDSISSCYDFMIPDAEANAHVLFYQYIESKKALLKADFEHHIKTNLTEVLTLQRQQMKYAITLYRYDRVGNLIATIPPEGVKTLSDLNVIDADNARKDLTYQDINYNLQSSGYGKQSSYYYNSLNQLITQITPDAGETKFYYDPSGKVVFSQNAKQKLQNRYSYTLYDDQNRIVETGQVKINVGQTVYMDLINRLNNYQYSSLELNGCNKNIRELLRQRPREDVVRTFYDEPLYDIVTPTNGMSPQDNLRARVTAVVNYDHVNPVFPNDPDNALSNINVALHYSYDLSGNVKTLTYDMPALNYLKQRYKRIDYNYDLYSGKVNLVSYNRGFADQFYQQYSYDDDNRITQVKTSKDGLLWDDDAQYQYYPHGPLARIALGDLQVQGVDFAYTLQGWLKSINGDTPNPLNDIGGDAHGNSAFQADLHRTTLNYYQNDYKPIDASNQGGSGTMLSIPQMPADRSLYNGNIASILSLPGYFDALYSDYWYDQLNRIKEAKYKIPDYTVSSSNFSSVVKPFSAYGGGVLGSNVNADDLYRSTYSYDMDGNLKTLSRFGLESTAQNLYNITNAGSVSGGLVSKVYKMDNINYFYAPGGSQNSNKLSNYTESIDHTAITNFDNDLQHYNPSNAGTFVRFEYDAIGNLTKDLSNPSLINSIGWNLYGKVRKISQTGNDLVFKYEPSGNRFMKSTQKPTLVSGSNGLVYWNEYYIREASGNILAIYKQRQEFKYTKPFKELMTSLIPTSNFANNLALLVGNNGSFNESFLNLVTTEHLEEMQPLVMQFSPSFYLQTDPDIMANMIHVTPDLIEGLYAQDAQRLMDLTQQSGVDIELLYPFIHASDSSTRALFYPMMADTTVIKKMRSLAGFLVEGAVVNNVNDFRNVLESYFSSARFESSVSALTEYYSEVCAEGDYQYTLSRILSTPDYLNYSHDFSSFITVSDYVKFLVTNEKDLTFLIDFYDQYPNAQNILDMSAEPPLKVIAIYNNNKSNFFQFFKVLTHADHTLGTALGDIAGYSPAAFASDYADISMDAANDVASTLIPILEKDKYYLAEHHLYGSSRLGIKNYWHNQYVFNWEKNSSVPYNNIQFENVELASRRPWYSQVYNSLISANHTTPYGFANVDTVSSERVLGQKQYELTNHLGNVMAVITDKVTESPLNTSTAPSFPAEVRKRAALSASYDYYPFGMLMPARYVQDETEQFTPVTLSTTTTQLLMVEDMPLATVGDLDRFTRESGTSISLASEGLGIRVIKEPQAANYGFFTTFSQVTPNMELDIDINITQTGNAPVLLTLSQFDESSNTWEILDQESKTYPGEVKLHGTPGGTGPLKVQLSSVNDVLSVNSIQYLQYYKYASSHVALISSKDPEFEEDYRFGFNGMQKDNEVKGIGNSLDFGARVYDSRLGRWLSCDPASKLYPGISTYNFSGNTPIMAKDPDGKLVIFINGQHLGHEGGMPSYWCGVDEKIMKRIGDYHSKYIDGSSGGFMNTLHKLSDNNILASNRMEAGYKQGVMDAQSVINSLERDPNDPNKIIESVKIITHSMGTAYSRGYVQALQDYVTMYNSINRKNPLKGFQIETEVDIAAFQGWKLPANENVKQSFYMSGDVDVVAGGATLISQFLSLGSDVPGAIEIPTKEGTGHGIANFGEDSYINQIPKSNQNPSPFKPINSPIINQNYIVPSDNTKNNLHE